MHNDEKVETSTDTLVNMLTNTLESGKPLKIEDKTGLRVSSSGLLPLSEDGENNGDTVWGGSIILNSGELNHPSTFYKLRATTKRHCKVGLTCNRSKGIIPRNQVIVITYQLPESSIPFTNLTLMIDTSSHEIPLYKIPKADLFWIGKDTKVPTASQLRSENLLKTTNVLHLLRPFAKSLFRDLAELEDDFSLVFDHKEGGLEEEIAQEILRRFQQEYI